MRGAEERETRGENEGSHQWTPCYDRAVLAARIVAAVIALGAGLALAQAPARSFDIHVTERHVPPAQRVLRATEGERIELRWSADEPLVLHLHGYDIETRVMPGETAVTAFPARLTGRFPVAIHGAGGHRHRALLHVEIHPR
ncbi:MAG: hypothetical protein WEC13_00430 [Burkholderiales bacterium]